jgi:hypothetical protein
MMGNEKKYVLGGICSPTVDRDAYNIAITERDALRAELEKAEYDNGILTGERDVMTECRDALRTELALLQVNYRNIKKDLENSITDYDAMLKERDALKIAIGQEIRFLENGGNGYRAAVHLDAVLQKSKL